MLSVAEDSPWTWLGPLLVATALTLILTPAAIRVARRFRIIDRPIGMKLHKVATPLLGGAAVYVAFAAVAILFLPFQGPVRGIVLGGAIAVAVGIIDDKWNLPPVVHLGGQILATVVTILGGLGYLDKISNPLSGTAGGPTFAVPAVIGVAFTLFWIVGMMNTVNFLDGLDGLSGGVGAITAAMLAWWAVNNPRNMSFHHAELVLPVILVGALLGFLVFNWHPAKIFIGDSGAMFLGLALGAMSIFGAPKVGFALLILSVPVLDVAWAIVRRAAHGRSFLQGDKRHVYHRMIELGLSAQTTVLSLYALCLALGIVAVRLQRFQKLEALGVVLVATAAAFIYMEVKGERKVPDSSAVSSVAKMTAAHHK